MMKTISKKQLEILKFRYEFQYDVLMLDGAVRTGKTSIAFIMFIDWAMDNFNNKLFGVAGKTVDVAIKNIIQPYLGLSYVKNKYQIQFKRTEKLLIVSIGNKTNVFEIIGGKDESSHEKIRGRTYAGVFCDEVPLFPKSFFDMLLSRCSVDGSRMVFCSNPDNPKHWYYTDWICERKKRKAKYVRFVLDDNPSLTPKILERYKSQFAGVFYQRNILGEWVLAEDLVYFNFNEEKHIDDFIPPTGKYFLIIDYGITHPFACYLWCIYKNTAYCIDEYYYVYYDHNDRKRTDEEHYKAVDEIVMKNNVNVQLLVIDPSATSFKETVIRHGKYAIQNAVNDIINGVANCLMLLNTDYVKFNSKCKYMFKEFALYSWDTEANQDAIIDDNNHAMDTWRYFVNTILKIEFSHLNWSSK